MEKIRRSESIKNYVKAMLAVQKVMGKATRSADNPYFHSKYADLETVNDCIHAAITEAKVDLLIQQYPTISYSDATSKPRAVITTRVTEPESGEWEEFDIECASVEDKPQAVGSAITYLRRYGLMSMFNISPEDDDGNAGSGNDPMDQRRPEDRLHQTAVNRPPSQPAQRPPAARPATRPASQQSAAQQPVPTTAQVNQGLKTGDQVAEGVKPPVGDVITADQFDRIKDAAVKSKIPIRQFKAWLLGVYGYHGSAEILKSQYAVVLEILLKRPDVVKNYGTDPAVQQTPPLPRQPGQDDEEIPLPEPYPGV